MCMSLFCCTYGYFSTMIFISSFIVWFLMSSYKLLWAISCPPWFVYSKDFDLVTLRFCYHFLRFCYHFSCNISCLVEDLHVPTARSICWFFGRRTSPIGEGKSYVISSVSGMVLILHPPFCSPFKVSVAAFDDGRVGSPRYNSINGGLMSGLSISQMTAFYSFLVHLRIFFFIDLKTFCPSEGNLTPKKTGSTLLPRDRWYDCFPSRLEMSK